MLFDNPFLGTSVTKVTAEDADDPTVAGHATVTYQIIKGNEYFTVDDSGRSDMQVSNVDLMLIRKFNFKLFSFWTGEIQSQKFTFNCNLERFFIHTNTVSLSTSENEPIKSQDFRYHEVNDKIRSGSSY